MSQIRSLAILLLCLTFFLGTPLFCLDFVLVTADGGSITLSLPEDADLQDLYQEAQKYAPEDFFGFRLMSNEEFLASEGSFQEASLGHESVIRMIDQLDLADVREAITPRGDLLENSAKRDYHRAMTKDEVATLHYIVETLSSKPIALLLFMQSDLQEKGDALEHVHPLRVLSTIFMDESMKVGMRNMKRKRLVWTEWSAGMAESLRDAYSCDNLPMEYIQDMADRLGIRVEFLSGPISKMQWTRLIDILVQRVPRKVSDSDRYNF